MRTIIHVKPPGQSSKASFHARYLSERERNPEREEPATRPIFTHDRDGLKHTAADRYLTGGTRARAKSKDLQHVIIAFNSHDARELEKLGKQCVAAVKAKSSNNEDSEERQETRKSKIEQSNLEQTARDKPFAEAVRLMMKNLEEHTTLSELQYAMSVHRHTSKTHIHLLVRREYTNKTTDQKAMLHRFPKEFLNGRNALGKAQGGLLDHSLSDALDTMIPQKKRPLKGDSPAKQDRSHLDGSRNPQSAQDEPSAKAAKKPVKRELPGEVPVRTRYLDQPGSPPLRFVLRKDEAILPVPPKAGPQASTSPVVECLNVPAKLSVPDAEPATNLQLLKPTLPPNSQLLTVEQIRREIIETRNAALIKKLESSKIEDSGHSELSPDHLRPESKTNSQVTDRALEQAQLSQKRKSSYSRGR